VSVVGCVARSGILAVACLLASAMGLRGCIGANAEAQSREVECLLVDLSNVTAKTAHPLRLAAAIEEAMRTKIVVDNNNALNRKELLTAQQTLLISSAL